MMQVGGPVKMAVGVGIGVGVLHSSCCCMRPCQQVQHHSDVRRSGTRQNENIDCVTRMRGYIRDLRSGARKEEGEGDWIINPLTRWFAKIMAWGDLCELL